MPETVECPRCGYDLSGLAASWTQSCPLEGVCSECGLGLEWREVLNPTLTVPKWSFEHARKRRVWSALATIAALVRPVRFWTELRMAHAINSDRLLLLVIAMAILLWLMTSALAALLVRSSSIGWWWSPSVGEAILQVAAWPFAHGERWISNPRWIAVMLALMTPGLFLLLSDTFKLARVRLTHVVRVAMYSFVVALLAYFAAAALPLLALLNGSGSRRQTIDESGPATVVLVAFVLWHGRWWWMACTRYMRLPQARLIWFVMFGTALFGACTVWFAAATYSTHRNPVPWLWR